MRILAIRLLWSIHVAYPHGCLSKVSCDLKSHASPRIFCKSAKTRHGQVQTAVHGGLGVDAGYAGGVSASPLCHFPASARVARGHSPACFVPVTMQECVARATSDDPLRGRELQVLLRAADRYRTSFGAFPGETSNPQVPSRGPGHSIHPCLGSILIENAQEVAATERVARVG